jgi:hypothetical protein
MSAKTFFIFKTSSSPPSYIGYNMKPSESDPKSDVIYGIELKNDVSNPLYKGKDSKGNNLWIIDKPSSVVGVKDFDQNYTDSTRGVKLLMTKDKFSESVRKVIDEHKSGKSSAPTKSDAKPAKKKVTKKKSTKKGAKGGGKKKSAKNSKKKSKKKSRKKTSRKKR